MTQEERVLFVYDVRTVSERFPSTEKLSFLDRQMEQFAVFYEDMLEKNRAMNLTGITESRRMIVEHYLDSLAPAGLLADSPTEHAKLLDLGSGVGFPGIPLAIAFPALRLTLMDSLDRRVAYLIDEVKKFGLNQHTAAVHVRAEDLARQAE